MPDWSNPTAEVEVALREIGQGGAVRAFSAFDLFLQETEAELTSWRDFTGESVAINPDSSSSPESDKLDRFYARLGATHARVSHLWPIYRYFRVARDCIAHREGIASRALVEARFAPEMESALGRWLERTGETTVPELIPVEESRQIAFTHRQAIATSSVLRLIALDITSLVIDRLGPRGFVYLAACRTFLDDEPLPETLTMESMVKAFNNALSNRYRVPSYNWREALKLLRDLDLTKRCSARFATLQSARGLASATPVVRPRSRRSLRGSRRA
jgi:hypothetical protein